MYAIPNKMASIANNVMMSCPTEVSVMTPSAFADILIKDTNTGIITGKLRIAINVAEFLALVAIAEMKVKVTAIPILPSITARKNSGLSLTGFPATKPKTK